MEIEYKWDLPAEGVLADMLEDVGRRGLLGPQDKIRMCATYYDTAGQDVYRLHAGLRMRRENDRSVCCLKLPIGGTDACKARREFEVDAADIFEGLRRLPSVGAPQDVCESLLAGKPQPTCETDFVRHQYPLECPDFSAQLAIDTGEMRHDGRNAPIREVELELVSGSQDAFHAFAAKVQGDYSLVVQPRSKLARAITL